MVHKIVSSGTLNLNSVDGLCGHPLHPEPLKGSASCCQVTEQHCSHQGNVLYHSSNFVIMGQ